MKMYDMLLELSCQLLTPLYPWSNQFSGDVSMTLKVSLTLICKCVKVKINSQNCVFMIQIRNFNPKKGKEMKP
jgi:hypothetical protein